MSTSGRRSQDKLESYERLRVALRDLLGTDHQVTTDEEGEHPLLLLETSNDAAAFAVVNGGAQAAYEATYDRYRTLYREKHEVWRRRNLSFVLLRDGEMEDLDAFFGQVESDPYFCRKYVLAFARDHEGLTDELLRLPFLPLPPPHRLPHQPRPPDAAARLREEGAGAKLTRMLVEPGRASAQHIVDLALGPEELRGPVTSDEDAPAGGGDPGARLRLKAASLSGFRAYGKRQSFDLDASVVVLYGPNGLGKTSFFDAIDFACTGRIGRLCRRRISQGEFQALARNLAHDDIEVAVELEIASEGESHSVVRQVGDWGTASIDGEEFGRPETMQFLSAARWDGPRPRVQHLERLFRATHFFDQSTPELLVEFERDSTLSIDIVTRLLALDDYAAGVVKCGEVVDLLKKSERLESERIAEMEAEHVELEERLRAIPSDSDGTQPGREIRRLAQKLVDDLRAKGGIAVPTTGWVLDDVSDWRAMAEGLLQESRDRRQRIKGLQAKFPEYRRALHDREELTASLTDAEREVLEASEQLKDLRDKAATLEAEQMSVADELSDATARLKSLRELGELRMTWEETQKRLKARRKALAEEQEGLRSIRKRMKEVDEALAAVRSRKAEAIHAQGQTQDRLDGLKAVRSGVEQWKEAIQRIDSISGEIERLKGILAKNEPEVAGLAAESLAIRERLAKLQEEYRAAARGQAELTTLLDRLEGFIKDARCPACGIVHKSEDAVVRAIRSMKVETNALAEPLAERIREIESRQRAVDEYKAVLQERVATTSGRVSQLNSERENLALNRSAFEQSLDAFGLPRDPAGIVSSLEITIEEATKNFDQVQQPLTKEIDSEHRLVEERDELASTLTSKQEIVTQLSAEVDQLQKDSTKLEETCQKQGRRLECPSGEETQLAEQARLQKEKLEAGSKHQRAELRQAQREAKGVEQTQRRQEATAESLRSRLAAHKEVIAEIVGVARTLGFEEALTPEKLSEQLQDAETRVSVLDDLVRRALTLEGAIDAASRDTRRAELTRELADGATKLRAARESLSACSQALKWFSSMDKALREGQEEAVATHVDAFGPLTTLLQKRLRPVFGFGDIALKPRKRTIEVLVERDGRHVKPTNYFSDSQKQILALSIFLSARLTQTWSGFAPILLDDPVTHFDDLNAFAFVEAIRGIAGSGPNNRQFIISTCEERLYKLMHEKLSGVGGGARFYRFEGISRDGPIVSEVPA